MRILNGVMMLSTIFTRKLVCKHEDSEIVRTDICGVSAVALCPAVYQIQHRVCRDCGKSFKESGCWPQKIDKILNPEVWQHRQEWPCYPETGEDLPQVVKFKDPTILWSRYPHGNSLGRVTAV